jgi:hypothetical protein
MKKRLLSRLSASRLKLLNVQTQLLFAFAPWPGWRNYYACATPRLPFVASA